MKSLTTGSTDSTRVAGVIEFSAQDSYTVTSSAAAGAVPLLTERLSFPSFEAITAINISDVLGANDALKIVDAALGKIDAQRGDLGALQNRFESTIANLKNVAENLTAARSRIMDADIAQETSNMTKANILQQAGRCHPHPGQPDPAARPAAAPGLTDFNLPVFRGRCFSVPGSFKPRSPS